MSTSLDLFRRHSKHLSRRTRSAGRWARRPVLERLEDYLLLTTYTVTNTNAVGAGSLDAAIRAANTANSSTMATIDFNISGSAGQVQTIMVGAGLANGDRFQTIHVPIFFNGWSEGDFEASTPAGTYSGPPLIVIDGTQQDGREANTSVGPGLDFEGPSSLSTIARQENNARGIGRSEAWNRARSNS